MDGTVLSDLKQCVASGDVKGFMDRLVSYGCTSDTADEANEGSNLFFTALYNGHFDILETMVRLNVYDINIKNANGEGAIHSVCAIGTVDELDILIKLGANVNLPDEDGRTPLHTAARNDRVDMIRHLRKHGADPNLRTEGTGEPVLHYAITRSSDETVKQIICPSCVNTRSKMGYMPIHIAVKRQRLNIVKLLCENGADTDSLERKGFSPVHIAMLFVNFELLQYLLAINVSLDKRTGSGVTLLYLAASASTITEPKVIDLLLAAGYNIQEDSWIWNSNTTVFSEHNKDLHAYIIMCVLKVPSLKTVACQTVRRCIGLCLPKKVDSLAIPKVLKDQILLKNVCKV